MHVKVKSLEELTHLAYYKREAACGRMRKAKKERNTEAVERAKGYAEAWDFMLQITGAEEPEDTKKA